MRSVGDPDLRERFTALIDPIRFPEGGLALDDVVEVRRIKARVDDERLPRGADPNTHLKLGRGGLSDIEWTVQLLQMRHAGAEPDLRTPRTLEALSAASDVGLLSAADAAELAEAWRLVSRVRNAITLVRGKPGDQLPRDHRSAPPWPRSSATDPGNPTKWSTTTFGPLGAPGSWWTGSSGPEQPRLCSAPLSPKGRTWLGPACGERRDTHWRRLP